MVRRTFAAALVAALLGGTGALGVARLLGWLDSGSEVAITRQAAPVASAASAPTPLPLDAAAVYRDRAPGVVTVYAVFDGAHPGPQAQGSGFVVAASGHVLTNAHVVTTARGGARGDRIRAAEAVYVEFADGERIAGVVVGFDVYADIGVVRVDPDDHAVTPLPLGDSDKVVVGEPVAAIGSPFGQAGSLTVGVVSATGRSIASLARNFDLDGAIQTDAPINQGNSGGPLLNARGEVIGVNAQIRTDTGASDGVGFAVPINAAIRSLEELVRSGRVRYPWIGVVTRTLTPRIARRLGYRVSSGAAVQQVLPDSPASDAGVLPGGAPRQLDGLEFRPGGDVIVAIGGHPVRTAGDLGEILTSRLEPGEEVPVEIDRGGTRVTLDVLLADRPAESTAP